MGRFERASRLLLRVLRLPPEPTPPVGAPGSVQVFRAARNFYRLRLLVWTFKQVITLAGLVFAILALHYLEDEAAALRSDEADTQAVVESRVDELLRRVLPRDAVQFAAGLPPVVFVLLKIGELLGVLAFVAQIPVTYAAVRLDYELRWYIVTDRSLRIRAGIFRVQESTMSFANVQQVVVSQGPLQRALGIADLRVRSAGGGSGGEGEQTREDSLHLGIFHGVHNAADIRDLILERLRRFREAGLGDPDDRDEAAEATLSATNGDAVDAARRVLDEARRLREAVAATRNA